MCMILEEGVPVPLPTQAAIPCRIAGEASVTKRHRWASAEELWLQISCLSTHNQQPAPLKLQAHLFQTVVCIPLQRGGVLEVGTKELVPESDGVLSHILGFINGLPRTITIGAEEIISPAFEGGTPLVQYEGSSKPELKHNAAFTLMQGRTVRQRSFSSSYCSSSSATSSSPPADQKTSRATLFIDRASLSQISSMGVDNEEMLISPSTSSIEAMPAITVVNSLNQLNILNHMSGIDVHGSTAVSAIPYTTPFNYHMEHNNPDQQNTAASHVSHGPALSDIANYLSSTNVASVSEYIDTQYLHHDQSQNQPHDHQKYVYELSVLQRARNIDDFHSLEAAPYPQEINAHSASQSNDPQHQWGKVFSNIDIEGDRVTQLFGQSVRDRAHTLPRLLSAPAKAAAGSNPDNHSLRAPDMKMQDQGTAALVVEAAERSTAAIGYGVASMNDQKINPQDNAPLLILQDAGISRDNYINRKSLMALSAAGSSSANSANYRGFTPWKRFIFNQARLKKKSISLEGSALIKHVLRSFLPRLQTEMVRIRGSDAGLAMNVVQQYNYNMSAGSSGAQRSRRQPELARGDDDQNMDASISGGAGVLQNEAAVQHMFAERNRRRRQGDCFEALRTLVPNITKKDKVAILERTIEYLKEVQGGVCELEPEKLSLLNLKNNNSKDATESLGHHHKMSHSKHSISEKKSSQNASLLATCHYVPCLNVNHALHQFRLDMVMSVKDLKSTNDIAIEIISALQQRNLHCTEFNLKFDMPTNNFNATVVAMYKDGENYIPPSLDKIQEIEAWWPCFIQDHLNPLFKT